MTAPFEQATQQHAQELVSEIKENGPVRRPETAHEEWEQFASRVAGIPERAEAKKEPAASDAAPKENKGEKADPKAEAKSGTEPDGKPAESDKPKESQRQPLTPQQARQEARDRFLERAAKEPDFEQVVQRMNEPFFPQSPEGHARYQVLAYALGEVSNSDDVLYFLARPENASVAFNMQNAAPYKIAQTVHMISAELRFGQRSNTKSAATPAARPPKPPAEVGGRGAVPDDGAVSAAQSGNFAAFEKEMNKRARSSR